MPSNLTKLPLVHTSDNSKKTFRVAMVLVGAGSGTRFGAAIPKTYCKIKGRALVTWALEAWRPASLKAYTWLGIQPVISSDHEDLFQAAIADLNPETLSHILPPAFGLGRSRQDSVRLGLRALAKQFPQMLDFVLIHDAARPFTPKSVFDKVLAATSPNQGATASLPLVDSLHQIERGLIIKAHERDHFISAQTPQCFPFHALLEAHEDLQDQDFSDDVGLALAKGIAIKHVEGSPLARKITFADDLSALEKAIDESYQR